MAHASTGLADRTHAPHRIAVRRIASSDLTASLRAGWKDFLEIPTQLIFLCVLYPIVGLIAARAATDDSVAPLVWPLVAGLSLLGPICAVGLYEISRRREAGLPASAGNVLDVLRSPALPQIAAMAAILLGIFVAWVVAAHIIFNLTLGRGGTTGMGSILNAVLTTRAGLILLLVGNLVGAGFAVVVLAISAVSIPLMLDRNVGVAEAIGVSLQLVRENPVVMAQWGVMVAAMLALGCLPLFVGLAVAMPVLGHATWHLYRRAVV